MSLHVYIFVFVYYAPDYFVHDCDWLILAYCTISCVYMIARFFEHSLSQNSQKRLLLVFLTFQSYQHLYNLVIIEILQLYFFLILMFGE